MHGGVYRGARAPGPDVLHHDVCARIGAAEAVGAREQSVPGQSVNEDGCHLLILHVDVGVVHLGPGAEPLVLRVAGAPLERVRENVVEDVDRAVQGLGDVKQIVQRRARKVLERRGAAAVGLVLRRVLDLHAVLEDVVAIDHQAALGLDRELEVHLRPRPVHRAQDLDVVRRVFRDRVLSKARLKKCDEQRIASQPATGKSSGVRAPVCGIQS